MAVLNDTMINHFFLNFVIGTMKSPQSTLIGNEKRKKSYKFDVG